METAEGVESSIRLHDYAETGSDRSAGGVTRVAAVIVTAILLPWVLFRRGLRSLSAGLRRLVAVLARAGRPVRIGLTAVARLARVALNAMTRGTAGVLTAVVRGFYAASTAILRPVGAVLTVVGGLAETAAVWLWRVLTRIGRVVVALIAVTTRLLSAPARGGGRFLWRGACLLGTVLGGGWFAIRWAGSAVRTVGRALMRVLGRVLTTAGTVLWIMAVRLWRALTRVLSMARTTTGITRRVASVPFRLAWRAALPPLRSLWRGAVAVIWLLGRGARSGVRGLARVLSVGGRLAWRAALPPLRSLWRGAVAVMWLLGRGARSGVRGLARVLSVGGRLAWRAALPPLRSLWRGAAAVIRLLVRAARSSVRGLARVLSTAGRRTFRIAVAPFRATGGLVRKMFRPALSALTILVALAGRLLTGGGRRLERVLSLARVRLARVVAAGSRARARWGKAWRHGTERIAEASAGLSRRTADGARVAAGTARHRASRLAVSAPSSEWRVTACADGSPPIVSEDQNAASFTLDVHENEYLRPGQSTISAVISVSSEINQESTTRPEMVEVILLDCSASMGHPWDKILHARRATQAAVMGLPDGVWFAVVRGAESAEVAYPARGGLVRASDRTRGEAFRAINRLQPVGGTAIGRWLSLTSELVALRPGALGHALLLTDGKDEDESPTELRQALEECQGAFQCDCRGVGTDWAVDELRRVSTALLGTVDIIKEPAGMEADFRSVIEQAMGRGIEVSMRLRTPVHAKVTALRQVSPTVVELTSQARRIDAQTIQFRLGGWGDERREYHLGVDMEPGPVGSEMAACRLALVAAHRTYSSGLLRAIWTDDPELTARIDPDVAHYTGQSELATAVQEGLQARREGDVETATLKLRRAVQLAISCGHTDLLTLLARVVDGVDGDTAKVSLRKDVAVYDEMALDTRSTRTVATRAGATLTAAATAEAGP